MEAESLVWFLVVLALFGLIVGAIGRLLVPGPTPLGVLGTMAAGVAGAFIGGFVGRLLLGPRLTQVWVWVLSILGAALVVALVSRRGSVYTRRPRRGFVHDTASDDRVVAHEAGDPYQHPSSSMGKGARGTGARSRPPPVLLNGPPGAVPASIVRPRD